ncbi:hypothetical protein [Plasmodium yoelii yoelii]|uniref:Uncharacterized protein n=1 Tax=Plasmodium yoelii yoelii TaxID=73239 RepID=Q7RH63_PLAYO|nr:hypothetical protein [Plasmodium yoelii yoelii]
MFSLLPFHWVH